MSLLPRTPGRRHARLTPVIYLCVCAFSSWQQERIAQCGVKRWHFFLPRPPPLPPSIIHAPYTNPVLLTSSGTTTTYVQWALHWQFSHYVIFFIAIFMVLQLIVLGASTYPIKRRWDIAAYKSKDEVKNTAGNVLQRRSSTSVFFFL